MPPPPLTSPAQASARGPAPVAIATATAPSQNRDALAWQIVSGCMMALLLVSLVVIYRCSLACGAIACVPLTFKRLLQTVHNAAWRQTIRCSIHAFDVKASLI
jgi:hypothetical protein